MFGFLRDIVKFSEVNVVPLAKRDCLLWEEEGEDGPVEGVKLRPRRREAATRQRLVPCVRLLECCTVLPPCVEKATGCTHAGIHGTRTRVDTGTPVLQ